MAQKSGRWIKAWRGSELNIEFGSNISGGGWRVRAAAQLFVLMHISETFSLIPAQSGAWRGEGAGNLDNGAGNKIAKKTNGTRPSLLAGGIMQPSSH